jgi:RNA polymerase sigma-70 factor (ECF subfamily)
MNTSLKVADGRSEMAPERTAPHSSSHVKLRTLPKSGLAAPRQTGPRPSGPVKPESATLNQAIRLAQLGDAAAFETIYQLHSRRVYALCLRMAGDPAEAEDLTQEAFLQLFRKIHTFRGESAFSSWLHRLTANIVLMRFRKKRPVQVSLDEMTSPDGERERPTFEIGGPDLRLAGVFDRVNLHTAIEQLPEGYRSMFLLHEVQGYEHKEIAQMLGCSIGNSKSQLHKARKRLRELLNKIECYGCCPSQTPASA